jgi:hypothetical protein
MGEQPISWGVQGPQGPSGTPGSQGPQGSQGSAGTSGTARAYGFVAYDGKLSQSKNASVTHLSIAEDSINCISVPGVSAEDTPILVTPEVSGNSNLFTGSTIFSGGGFTGEWGTTFVVWDRQHPHCTATQWEIRGYSLLAEDEIAEGNIEVIEVGEPFSFVVP